ncbi:Na+/H+ antiporter NhaC [Rhodococcus koreensis]
MSNPPEMPGSDLGELDSDQNKARGGLGVAALAVVSLLAVFVVSLLVFHLPLQVAMLGALLVATGFALLRGYTYAELESFGYDAVRRALTPIFILIAVGGLIGTWTASGTIAYMVDLGLQVISPNYFLITALLLCSALSLATGTSWGTVGTVGIALIAVAHGMGVNPAMAAGAVICGALFGDKISPMSDSTNLAPAVAGAPLMEHIRHLQWTTLPVYVMSGGIFLYLDLSRGNNATGTSQGDAITTALESQFNLSWVVLLPVFFFIALLLLKKPPFVSIVLASIVAALISVFVQGMTVGDAFSVIYDGYEAETGNAIVDKLLTGGGMTVLLGVVVVILLASAMGGVLYRSGIISDLLDACVSRLKTARGVVLTTLYGTLGLNFAIGDLLGAMVLGGSLMSPLYRKFGIAPKTLSRTLEDATTMTAPGIPWNTSALYMSGVLGITTLSYLPYTFVVFLTPLVATLYAVTGIAIARTRPETDLLVDEDVDATAAALPLPENSMAGR